MSQLEYYQGEVADAFKAVGYAAEVWHSGGGIYGVRLDFGDSNVFSTLSSDGGAFAWTVWDWCDNDGLILAELEIQARPFDHPAAWAPACTPEEMVKHCQPAFDRLLGHKA